MHVEASVNSDVKKLRTLSVSLIFSLCLNLGFLVTMVVNGLFVSPSVPVSLVEKNPDWNFALMKKMMHYSFPQLASCLTNQEPAGPHLLKRDLALSALISFHHFHVEKAIGRIPEGKWLVSDLQEKIYIYCGLTDREYQEIVRFAYEEKWPFTVRGLFLLLKQSLFPDASLRKAFFETDLFRYVQRLFSTTAVFQDPCLLLSMFLEGDWDLFEQAVVREYTTGFEETDLDQRRRLLLTYLKGGSSSAAQLLVATDSAFLESHLDDQNLIVLLKLLPQNSLEANVFCKKLLQSSRAQSVSEAGLDQFPLISQEIPEQKIGSLYYTVQDGDNLWKIAKLHQVKMEELLRCNELSTDRLYPGMVLRIPN